MTDIMTTLGHAGVFLITLAGLFAIPLLFLWLLGQIEEAVTDRRRSREIEEAALNHLLNTRELVGSILRGVEEGVVLLKDKNETPETAEDLCARLEDVIDSDHQLSEHM